MYSVDVLYLLFLIGTLKFSTNGFKAIPSKLKVLQNNIVTCNQLPSQLNGVSTENNVDRRTLISSIIASSAVLKSIPSNAVDPLFKTNPLTNSILEKIRIVEQEEANAAYKGQLASPDLNKNGDIYTQLLLPILSLDQSIYQINNLIYTDPSSKTNLKEAQSILQSKSFQTPQIKKTFNNFADNIYYTDPDRANAYLGGGATPKNEQSIAYLLRNDLITNIEALRAEVDYLLKEEDDVADLKDYSKKIRNGMIEYLALVPPKELDLAREEFKSISS